VKNGEWLAKMNVLQMLKQQPIDETAVAVLKLKHVFGKLGDFVFVQTQALISRFDVDFEGVTILAQ